MRPVPLIIVAVVVLIGGFVGYKVFVEGEKPTDVIQQAKETVKDAAEKVDVPETPYGKGLALQRATKYEEAIAEYRKVINARTDPEEVEHAHFRIAQCFEEARKYPQALQAYNAALKKYPQSKHADKAQKAVTKIELER